MLSASSWIGSGLAKGADSERWIWSSIFLRSLISFLPDLGHHRSLYVTDQNDIFSFLSMLFFHSCSCTHDLSCLLVFWTGICIALLLVSISCTAAFYFYSRPYEWMTLVGAWRVKCRRGYKGLMLFVISPAFFFLWMSYQTPVQLNSSTLSVFSYLMSHSSFSKCFYFRK